MKLLVLGTIVRNQSGRKRHLMFLWGRMAQLSELVGNVVEILFGTAKKMKMCVRGVDWFSNLNSVVL